MTKGELTVNMMKWGVLAAVIAIATPELSIAQTLGSSVITAGNQITNIPSLVSGFAYILGAVLVMAGALSLKKHSEAPASEPMAKGVGRLLAGGAIISLPALAGYIQSSSGLTGASAVGYKGFGTI